MNLRLLTSTPFAGVITGKVGHSTLFAMILALLIGMSELRAQAISFSSSECVCLNNATAPGNGLFQETFTITQSDPPSSWTLVSATGFFRPESTPENLIEYTPGSSIAGIPNGMGQNIFTLPGRRVDGQPWTIVVSNGTTNFTVSSIHNCVYPPVGIIGDRAICESSSAAYRLPTPITGFSSLNWTLSGGGSIVGPNNTAFLDVQWGSTPGVYTLNVTGNHQSSATQPGNFCPVNYTAQIEVLSNIPRAMACNNLVNLSMNANCELFVLPEVLLEGNNINNDAYHVILTDPLTNAIVPQGILSQSYLGRTLMARVVHKCSANSCWGMVLLEDKNIPPLVCGDDVTIECNELTGPAVTGFPFDPLNDNIIITPVPGFTDRFIVSGFDNCSDVSLRYFDIATDVLCNGPYSSIVERTWVATDISGNSTSCVNTIYVLNATLDDLVFPGSWDDVLGPNPSLDPCGGWPKLENGHPSPEFTGSPMGTFCLNVEVVFTDINIPVCTDENSFKILRRWTVTDKCTYEVRTHVQTITVMDMQAPVAVAPPEFDVITNPHSCESMIDVPAPIVVFECSSWDYFVSYKLRDESGDPFKFATDQGVIRNPNGTYKITNVPAGQDSVWIVYTIVDACSNVTQVFTEAAIIDREEPVAICDQFSFIALNDDGEAWAGPLTFDDKSWDNCAIDRFEVRRMTAACGVNNNWSDKVKFCCEDIGQTILVELRVYDKAGNSNTCMVNATVQDNRPPRLSNCPANITVNCSADVDNLAQYGVPTFADNCGATLREEVTRNFNDCGEGTVVRRFIATDNFGNTAQCSQVITVSAINRFGLSNIIWPADHTITNGCADASISPDNLPVGRRRPIMADVPCSRVAADYEDIVFQYVDGVCFKVLRKWTVIDWCQFNPFMPNQGRWERTQVIKILNSTPPTITRGCGENDIETTLVDDCRARIVVRAQATDDCTPADQLQYSYQIDLNNNGSIDISGNGSRIDRIVDFGSHRVIWRVSDECGNETTCSRVFEIRDTKKPTPYCFSQIVTVIMPTTGTITIWASDFDAGSFDNCTPKNQLRFSFSSNTNNRDRTFNCNDLTGIVTYINMPIFVTDLAGNSDFCSVTIQIQDNHNTCNFNNNDDDEDDEEEESRYMIAGKVMSETQSPVANVTVSLEASLPEFPKKQITDATGTYSFGDLAAFKDYKINLDRDGAYNEGISTLDLVLIQRHILQVQALNSPFKIIAADVTGDDRVSAADLVALRRLVLGIDNKFPAMPSWRFIDRLTVFNDPSRPFPVTDGMQMQDLASSYPTTDFVAIKLGDVNNTWQDNFGGQNSSESRSIAILNYEAQQVKAGENFKVGVLANNVENLLGLQFALKFDERTAALVNVKADQLDMDEQNMSFHQVGEGILPISWNAQQAVTVHGTLFTLEFTALQDMNTANLIRFASEHLTPELYTETHEKTISTQALQIRSTGSFIKEYEFELHQNKPNPFSHSTNIGFVLPEDGEVVVKFYDTAGRVVFTHEGTYSKGFNSFDISGDQLTPGILYYQLESKTHTSTRKMIVIK